MPETQPDAAPLPQMPALAGASQAEIKPADVREIAALKHGRPQFGCRFDPTGRYLLAGAEDYFLQRWDLTTKEVTKLASHESWVRAIACTPDGRLACSADYAGGILGWDLAAAERTEPAFRLTAHDGWVRALDVSRDGQLLASVGNDLIVRVWSLAERKLIHEFPGHTRHIYNVRFHPDGVSLVTVDLLGETKHWDLSAGKLQRDLAAKELHKYDKSFRADIGGARGMAFSPDGRYLYCSGITNVSNAFAGIGNPLIVCFDWAKGEIAKLFKVKGDYRAVAWGVVAHPNGTVMAALGGGSGGLLGFWTHESEEPAHTFKLPTLARDLALHPNHTQVAVALADGHLRLYDLSPKPAEKKS